jgi:hypothetical protein
LSRGSHGSLLIINFLDTYVFLLEK